MEGRALGTIRWHHTILNTLGFIAVDLARTDVRAGELGQGQAPKVNIKVQVIFGDAAGWLRLGLLCGISTGKLA